MKLRETVMHNLAQKYCEIYAISSDKVKGLYAPKTCTVVHL